MNIQLVPKQRVFICSVLHRPPLWPIWQVIVAGKRYSNLNQGLLKELQSGTTPEELGLDPDDEEETL